MHRPHTHIVLRLLSENCDITNHHSISKCHSLLDNVLKLGKNFFKSLLGRIHLPLMDRTSIKYVIKITFLFFIQSLDEANVILFWITYPRVPHLKENNLWTTVLLMLVRCMAHVSIRVETLLEMKIQFLLDLLATLLAKKPQHQCYHLIQKRNGEKI